MVYNLDLVWRLFLNRDEAALIIQELLQTCIGMDDVYLCMVPPTATTPITSGGYQIHIKTMPSFNEDTTSCIETITKKHGLAAQEIKEQEKMIIYRPH
jgi:hypothetical protein